MEHVKHAPEGGAPAAPRPALGGAGKVTILVEAIGNPVRDGVVWVSLVGRGMDGRRTSVHATGGIADALREAFEMLDATDLAALRVGIELLGRWIYHSTREEDGKHVVDLRLSIESFRFLGEAETWWLRRVHRLISAHVAGRGDEVRAILDEAVREMADDADRREWLTPPPYPPTHPHAVGKDAPDPVPLSPEEAKAAQALKAAFSAAVLDAPQEQDEAAAGTCASPSAPGGGAT